MSNHYLHEVSNMEFASASLHGPTKTIYWFKLQI